MPAQSTRPASATYLTLFFLSAFAALALTLGYWTFVTRDALLTRPDNPRALIAFNRIQRGSILDRNGQVLAETVGRPGDYVRHYEPATALVVGYASFTYGLSSIEAAANEALTGINDLDAATRWWKYEVLDEPQIGQAISLTIDLALQRAAYQALNGQPGAVVILDAISGDILTMASSPSFDPAQLDSQFDSFTADSNGPLINRATLGLYRAADLINLFPPTLDLTQTPGLPIPVQQAEGARITPIHLAFLIATIANEGLMPVPRLIADTQALVSQGGALNAADHPIALIPPVQAAELRPFFMSAYNATTLSGFEDETLGWYVALQPADNRVTVIVLENSAAPQAAALAAALAAAQARP